MTTSLHGWCDLQPRLTARPCIDSRVSIASPVKGALMPTDDPSDGSDRLYTLAEAAAELQRIADALFDNPSDAPEHLLAALDDLHASYIAPGSEESDAEAEAE
ncbi:hypothetical protein DSP71_02490 [Microbacterium sp. H6]|nr:hypothetical protein DSP71_02490 [Microbacterium sp. H6]